MKRSGLFLYSILVLLVFMSGCRVEPESEAAPAVEIPDALVLTPSAVALPTLATETPGSIASEVAQPTPSIPTSAGVLGERSIGDAYIPELGNTGYDVQQYTLRLALDPQRVYLDAHVTVEAIASIEQIAQISLDFIGYEIEEVSMGGAPVVFSREERKLVVDLPEPLSEGQLFALDIIYRGEPVFEASPFVPFISHLGLQFPEPEQSGGVYAVSEPDGARYWFPCNDHPRDKATFRFELGVPEGLSGAANGVLIESRLGVPAVFADGSPGDVTIWEHNYPMATYLATVVVGDYQRLEGISQAGVPLRHYVFPEQVSQFESQEENIGAMVGWMSDRLGNYPFEAFGFASVSTQGVSLETQTLVILDEHAGEYVMAHELAHMWFGNWVSLHTWADMWRNEGFATYFGAWWSMRNDPVSFERYMADLAESYQDYVPVNPLNQPSPGALFGRDSYMRGALLVHDLRGLMGDEAFLEGLRIYLERFGGGTATHAQFQAVMEEFGEIDLDDFFATWFR
jgi:aminopeptidase N